MRKASSSIKDQPRRESSASSTAERVRLTAIISRLDAGVSVNAEDRAVVDGEHGVLKVSAVTVGHFNPDENKVVVPADLSRVGISPKRGDLLVTRANTRLLVAAAAYVHRDYPNLHLSDKIWSVVLRDSRRDDMRWLKHILSAAPVRAALIARASGTSGSMKNVSKHDFLGIVVDRLSADEQRATANVLDTWDSSIAAARGLMKARRRLRRGLLQRLLTGQHRFPEFRKQPWRECQLRDVAEECSEPGRGTLGRDRIMGVTKSRGIVPMEDRLIGNVDRYQIVRKDWFAYNPMRLNIGSIARSRSKSPVLVSPDYVVFRCRDGELDPAFLDQYRKGHLWDSFMRVCGAGSVRVRIYFNDLGRHKMHLPLIEEQRRIAEALGTLDGELSQLRQLHDALTEQKKGLMQKLLTGTVRVPASMLKEAAHG